MPGLLARRKPLPKPSPESDPRFRKVMEALKHGAARTKSHPSAAKKAGQASAAAKGPPHERLAAGKAKQVDKIEEAPTKKPEASSFLAVLQAEIAKAMPKTLADTEKFMKGGSSEELKGSLKGNVSQQKEKAEGGVKSASKEPPKEAGPGTPGAEIPKEPTPAAPPINGAEAMPAAKSDADVSLQDSKQDTEDQMKQAEVTDTQLKKANDPRFSAVLTSKDAVAKQADAAPAQYRAQEKGVLSTAAVAAKLAGTKGAHAMVAVRGGSNSAVLSKQNAAKARDEAKRKEVVDHIEEIYNRTKTNVENKLSTLETDVGALFDAGTDAALKAMTDYTEAKIDAYKDDRYSGLIGKGRWIRDKFKGLPEEANVFYEQGRALFTRLMNNLVVKVAAIVEKRLKEAKDEVAKGQSEIKSYVASQPKELQAVAKKAQSEVADRFKELEHSIDDKKQQLAESLAQKYKEGFDKANEALKKIQDANKGLVARFIEKLKAVIEAIIAFKNKLMGILRKGARAIGLILDDPIGFLGNLLDAIKQGFNWFKDHIVDHLKAGFMKWLSREVGATGIEIPRDLSLLSILKLVLSVLGITYERIRAKAVRLVGERAVKFIELVGAYIKTVFTGGLGALWELVKDDLGNLKEMVIDAMQDWLITTIIKKAVTKIATMFNPVGAIVQAILAIVDVVVFVVEKANEILDFIAAVVESLEAIALGQITSAAKRIEQALEDMIPLLIGFLAQLLGLGGIGEKAKQFITKVQDRVDKAMDKAVAKVVAVVRKLVGGVKDKAKDEDPEKSAKVAAGLADLDASTKQALHDGKLDQAGAEKVAASTKGRHPVFKVLRPALKNNFFNYVFEASPAEEHPGAPSAGPDEQVEVRTVKADPRLKNLMSTGKTFESAAKETLFTAPRTRIAPGVALSGGTIGEQIQGGLPETAILVVGTPSEATSAEGQRSIARSRRAVMSESGTKSREGYLLFQKRLQAPDTPGFRIPDATLEVPSGDKTKPSGVIVVEITLIKNMLERAPVSKPASESHPVRKTNQIYDTIMLLRAKYKDEIPIEYHIVTPELKDKEKVARVKAALESMISSAGLTKFKVIWHMIAG